jgi:tetraacyldisaccharide 4'-kinase
VICVGDLATGGAGKTPATIAIARMLLASGGKPMILSRGYRGTLKGPVRVSSDHRAAQVGDEPLLLARHAPTIVARDRAAGAIEAVASGASAIIMDDGFQNPALNKDFTLIVIDGERGIGNGRVLPAGPLRAPLASQIACADAALVFGTPAPSVAPLVERARAAGLAILGGRLVPDPGVLASLAGKRLLAFAGIGHPDKFFATLTESGADVAATRAFPDHHQYSRSEAQQLIAQAGRDRLTLVTTEKDMARMHGERDLAALAEASTALPVTLAMEDGGQLARMVAERARVVV